jgi:predicted nuclease of predicted toxin-antitoxin system
VRKFLVDNQLPNALAVWLETKGCGAEHVLNLKLGQAKDEEIWRRAAELGCVIISKDEDFTQITLLRPEPVAVVWLRIGNLAGCYGAGLAGNHHAA